MASWFQNQIRRAEELVESLDRTAKSVKVPPLSPGPPGASPSVRTSAGFVGGPLTLPSASTATSGSAQTRATSQQESQSVRSARDDPKVERDVEDLLSGLEPVAVRKVRQGRTSGESATPPALVQPPPQKRTVIKVGGSATRQSGALPPKSPTPGDSQDDEEREGQEATDENPLSRRSLASAFGGGGETSAHGSTGSFLGSVTGDREADAESMTSETVHDGTQKVKADTAPSGLAVPGLGSTDLPDHRGTPAADALEVESGNQTQAQTQEEGIAGGDRVDGAAEPEIAREEDHSIPQNGQYVPEEGTAEVGNVERDEYGDGEEAIPTSTGTGGNHGGDHLSDMQSDGGMDMLEREDSQSSFQPDFDDGRGGAMGGIRGLLSGGVNSKEARLARVCEKLNTRLSEYKAENEQLEELLQQSEQRSKEKEGLVQRLQDELRNAVELVSSAESQTTSALAIKNKEVLDMQSKVEAMQRHLESAEARAKSVQAENEALYRSKDMTESRVLQSLREELALVERRLEEERAAHAATRQALGGREADLEAQLAEDSTALSVMQRALDERAEKLSSLERRVAIAEMEASSLRQELTASEAKLRREQQKSTGANDETRQAEVAAWREEVDRLKRKHEEAEAARASAESEVSKLKAAAKATARMNDNGEPGSKGELEKRFRELTELLYLKQTQLESMAADKAAAQLALEHESRRMRDQFERERAAVRRAAASVDVEDSMRPIESLGPAYERLRNVKNVGPGIESAAKFLDSTAVQMGRFFWRQPLARIGVVVYVIFIHLFIYILLHRLQAHIGLGHTRLNSRDLAGMQS